MILNLGCGVNRKRLYSEPFSADAIHIDHNPEVKPTIVWDIENGLPPSVLPNTVDEIHAYHLIEHIGVMGDTKVWFAFWRACWRALKPGGIMYAIAPYYMHEDAIGDPTHTRLICRQTFHFLNRDSYKVKDGEKGCAMSKLSIDFDLPLVAYKEMTKPGEIIPYCVVVGLEARKTEAVGMADCDKKELQGAVI